MKNIKFIYGILALCWLPLSMDAQPGITQNRRVNFLHGLNGSNGSWNPFATFLRDQDNRRMNITNPSFTSDGGLGAIASDASGQSVLNPDAIAICHSMGGVIARRIDRAATSPNQTFGGIITVGSPMDGAPVANSVVNGDAGRAIGDAFYAISRGPLASLGFANFTVQFFGNSVGAFFLPEWLDRTIGPSAFGNDAATLNDLKVGGSGIESDKNANPTNTPKISIWGNEDSPTHWNIIQTGSHLPTVALNGFPVQLTVPELATGLSYAYLAGSIVCATIAIILLGGTMLMPLINGTLATIGLLMILNGFTITLLVQIW
jgi:pimeloyl-ACP methyl ester carboxylesterase